jgi:predicted outer membrane protein
VADYDAYTLAAARMATQKAKRDDIKLYAGVLVTQHQNATKELGDVSNPIGLGRPTSGVTLETDARLQQLNQANDASFETLFLRQQHDAAQSLASYTERYAAWAPDAALTLRDWAKARLSVIQDEAQRAQALLAAPPPPT